MAASSQNKVMLTLLLQQAIELVYDNVDDEELETDDEIEVIVSSLLDSASTRMRANRIKNWCEETVPRYTDKEFFRYENMN